MNFTLKKLIYVFSFKIQEVDLIMRLTFQNCRMYTAEQHNCWELDIVLTMEKNMNFDIFPKGNHFEIVGTNWRNLIEFYEFLS